MVTGLAACGRSKYLQCITHASSNTEWHSSTRYFNECLLHRAPPEAILPGQDPECMHN